MIALAVKAALARIGLQIEAASTFVQRLIPAAEALVVKPLHFSWVEVISLGVDKCASPVYRTATAESSFLRTIDFVRAAHVVREQIRCRR
jgi:hypothetical protein